MSTPSGPTISDALELPRPEDIRAMGFVIRLEEAEPTSAQARRLVDDYVVTPAVERELPRILEDMRQVFHRGEEYGRFIHGSFGSGKSHFMSMLALLLEGAPPAWDKLRPLLGGPKAADGAAGTTDHEAWLGEARLLVVRLHMLSVRGRATGLDRAVYDAFNAALKRRGRPPFEPLDLDGIFAEVRREAEAYGDIVWKRLETAGIVGGRADFEALEAGSPAGREAFAHAWLDYKGRDPAQAGLDPRFSDGLRRMGDHARAMGFGGIVLLVDELLLWLAEKAGHEFAREINNLNLIVDHNTGQRPLPVFVFVARQRNLQEFFPDLVDEAKIHEHLDHHAKRFEQTVLEDVELRHIVRGRVLRARRPELIQGALEGLVETHQRVLPALLAGADIAYLRDVYPFHPALIEMLVDVTSLMQRERSALRLLYELLVVHYPDLPVGELLPVGSAFPAIFPPSGVEASKKVELMQDIHRQYYTRLLPAMGRMAEESAAASDAGGFDSGRARALDQLVKTVLLAEVSPRLKQEGLTVERLVQLNAADVEGETFRGRLRVAETDLLALAQRVPDLQIAGEGRTAYVRYMLGRVSLGEILSRARSKVDSEPARAGVFFAALKQALGLAGLKGFEGDGKEGEWDLDWRRTRRRGRVKLCNVREQSNEDFLSPPGAFRVLIDYPWDDPGHSVEEDRARALAVRRSRGVSYTVCWLPRHMSPPELQVLTDLAAVRYLLSEPGREDLMETLAPGDRVKVSEQAGIRARNLEGQLEALLRELYVEHGELVALISDVDGSRPRETLAENLLHIATLLMDRQFPQHPHFGAEPGKQSLEALLEWMVQAGETSASVGYDEATGRVLRTLGQPLELVNLGQTKASLRLDSRYIKEVLRQADTDSLPWAPVAERLREVYGLQPLVTDLFLCFLCRRDHRALEEVSGDPLEVRIGLSPSQRVRLQRGTLLGAADWSRLRELGSDLFGVPRPPAHRSLQGQDRFAETLAAEGRARRAVLQGLHERLVGLGAEAGERARELQEAIGRLAPLSQTRAESHVILGALLGHWPEEGVDPLRGLVRGAESLRESLGGLDNHARENLLAARGQPRLGAEVAGHLTALEERLAAAQATLPLDGRWIQDWNERARGLVRQLVGPAGPDPEGGDGGGRGWRTDRSDPERRVREPEVIDERALDPGDDPQVERFLADLRAKLAGRGGGRVRVTLLRLDDAP